MALRKIIHIDEEKCDGCGLCAAACHEGAIGLVNGKARLLREDFCDGLGDCLPACPQGAISFEERQAPAYNAEAVKAAAAARAAQKAAPAGGCPFTMPAILDTPSRAQEGAAAQEVPSQISTWPIQVKLVSPQAPYFKDADLLIAADCTAFAYGNFHARFMAGKVCLIACPKLDNCDYSQKLAEIFSANNIRSITLARMVVPCCGGLEMMCSRAIAASGKNIPLEVVTISLKGDIL